MNGKIMPMETRRLVLREIKEEDACLIVKWRSDPEVYQYFLSPKPLTEEEHLNWYFNYYMKDNNRIDFIAIEKDYGKKAGVFSIMRDIKNRYCSEIGYLLDKELQGKGYAQEAVKRLMLFAEKKWKCEEAVFTIHEKNKASQVLACRLGFKETSKKGKFILYHTVLENISIGYQDE